MNTTGRGVVLRVLMLCAALFALAMPATASAQATVADFGVNRVQSLPLDINPGIVLSPLDYPAGRLVPAGSCGVDNPAVPACPRLVNGTNEHSPGAFPGLL